MNTTQNNATKKGFLSSFIFSGRGLAFLTASILMVVLNGNAQSGKWNLLPTNFNDNIRHVHFSDDQNGYISLDSHKVFRTRDGGVSWLDVSPNFTFNGIDKRCDYGDIYSLDSLTMFSSNSCHNFYVRTFDGGITWDSIPLLFQTYHVKFISNSIGFMQGGAGMYRTSNRGISWSKVSSNAIMGDLFFVDQDTGYAAGLYNKMYKSTDAGLSWNPITVDTIKEAYTVFFFDKRRGIVAGQQGHWSITNDYGKTWKTYGSFFKKPFWKIHFVDDSTGYAVSGLSSRIIEFNGGGLRAKYVDSLPNTQNGLVDLNFPSNQTGYAVGTNGTIFKYSKPQVIALSKIETKNQPSFSIYPNPAVGLIHIENTQERQNSLTIFDISGELIYSENFSGNQRVDITSWSTGMYFLNITNESETYNEKILIR